MTLTLPYLQQIPQGPQYQCFRALLDQLNKVTIAAAGGVTGTLSPDQKPTNLGPTDIGSRFFASDYARAYQWTGSAWTDTPDAPARFSCVLFAQAPQPPIGWSIADGRTVTISTSSGGVTSYITPNLPPNTGLRYYVRL